MPASHAVLVIDDDAIVRQFVELVLTQAGYNVSSVATGELGIKALQTARWDLVLLDINIPDMTGLDVLRLLRKYQKVKAAVMMMTARGDLSTVREAMESGADGYLVKPFGPKDLLKRVEAMLNPEKFRAVPKDPMKDDGYPPIQLD
ncbi:response regulator transcription factor [Caulobacter segnis]|uniref:response regulator transcription factor n=1 Tax=Caulobacter segnis TaxID=88688 RepID=UPI001CBB548E|nr:response regulator transcription factor [Caulobacter segnis]UAL11155.1 response regulator transcription factor [Caulobacter segnis]